MPSVACPGCGAPLTFKSAASVMSVCEFCRTTVLKDADAVKDLGKMSAVLEDFSPLQIGSGGRYGERGFSLIGRIQLRYADGFWNEWHLLFDDGGNGWLSDASGQYALTTAGGADLEWPLFTKLAPGRPLTAAGRTYVTADVRGARCVAGEGELPFAVGAGYEVRAADFRAGDHFLSLDYSDGERPRAYLGVAATLADLKLQNLRPAEELKDAAGRYRGRVSALDCPSCGAGVKVVPGMTVHLVCPSCHAEVDTAGGAAAVLTKASVVSEQRLSLELGAEAPIEGVRYTVLGALRRTDGEGVRTEYFLYAPAKPFLWLIESDDGWQRAEVLDRWPEWDAAGRVQLDGRGFARQSAYDARVTFAAGSFNWRVHVGDTVHVTEYAAGPARLAAEATAEELTWSRARPMALDQVRAAVGEHVHAEVAPHPSHREVARKVLLVLLVVNLLPLLLAPAHTFAYALLGVLAIYVPAWYLDRLENDGA